MNKGKTALAVGLFIAGLHAGWALLLFFGLAQPLLNFAFWLHMLTVPYQVTGFTWTQSLALIAVTFVVGYVGGFVFAWLWNMMHK